MARDPLDFQRYRGNKDGWFDSDTIDMAQLTSSNYSAARQWLEAHGCATDLWTNESWIVGLWIAGTWHDSGKRTPVPFGWWLYLSPTTGRVGVVSEVALRKDYDPA